MARNIARKELKKQSLEQSPFIDQVMLYNNQSQYTVALIVPGKEAIIRWVKDNKFSINNTDGQKAVLKMLDGEINKYKSGGVYAGQFPERWIPSAVAVLGDGFTEQK